MSTTVPAPEKTGVRTLRNYVGGRWVDSSSSDFLDITNPATGDVLARVPLSSKDELDEAARTAREARRRGAKVSVIERTRWLLRHPPGVHRPHRRHRRDDHPRDGQDLPRRAGRGGPLDREHRGRVRRADDDAGQHPGGRRDGHRLRDHPPAGRRRRQHRALQLPGDGAVLVPALRHRVRQRLRAEALRAGADDAGPDVRDHGRRRRPAAGRRSTSSTARSTSSTRCSTRPDIDAISFVGSAKTARVRLPRAGRATASACRRSAAPRTTWSSCPTRVMDKTADNIIGSAFGAAGQRCMAGSVIVTVGDAKGPLFDALLPKVEALTVGDGMEKGIQVGPVVSTAARDRITGMIDKGIEAEGATLCRRRPPARAARTARSSARPSSTASCPTWRSRRRRSSARC